MPCVLLFAWRRKGVTHDHRTRRTGEAMTGRPSPQLARIAELERVYAEEYPTAPRAERKRWAVEGAQYEADERNSIVNEQ